MIYIITHKKVPIRPPFWSGHQLLQVGAATGGQIYPLTDAVGEHISGKNKTFCELTGLYWIWKNRRDDIIGLVHYRRFFVRNVWHKIAGRIPVELRLVTMGRARKILENCDMIVPKKFCYGTTVWENYSREHHECDLVTIEQIISERCPEYLPAFREILHGNEIYGCNMFVAKAELVDKYCSWLFEILFEAEQRIDISEYTPYQQRVFGFLSERLFNVYLRHHRLSVCEIAVDFLGDI